MHHTISKGWFDTETAYLLAVSPTSQINLSREVEQSIRSCRQYLDHKLNGNQQRFYGINTGFGALYNVEISPADLLALQKNLIMSHACGAGHEAPPEIVRLMLLLKIQSLSYGHSGVRLETVQRLTDFFNLQIHPVVYEQGSLGASGDLAPLSHLSLPLIGMGEVYFEGIKQPAAEVLKKFGLEPLILQSKEGLALINGTQFMSAYAVWCVEQANYLAKCADLVAAISYDAYDAHYSPLNPLIHEIRQQVGQRTSAQRISAFLEGSQIGSQPKEHVQDPYSFRCVPQVHGASLDAIAHVNDLVSREINAVTDNPLLFEQEDLILSGGNFHGQPMALGLDYLAIALSELGSISERRTFTLLNGQRNLPPFLIQNSGLHSGLMIPQYTAASIVSQNKQLCTPASIDSITSSNGQEDHVSMGANAATKCYRIVQNLTKILAIELLTATQALTLRKTIKSNSTLTSSITIEQVLTQYRQFVPFIDSDRLLHQDIHRSIHFIQHQLKAFLE
ncbi:MAG: histidine ammonia-lyase [Sphingobacteriales bacterium]|nr:MAG: histidine ammonia-lyase [Sphingobacteriales bacterium]